MFRYIEWSDTHGHFKLDLRSFNQPYKHTTFESRVHTIEKIKSEVSVYISHAHIIVHRF